MPSNSADTGGGETAGGEVGSAAGENHPRHLFRYLAGEEWVEYRAILGLFAHTYFAELTPEQVTEGLAETGLVMEPQTAGMRLESLRGWGNLTVSSSVGNPTSLEDYYRRRNRYLITRSGQEVFEFVEGLIGRVDEIGDVQLGRLGDLQAALNAVLAAFSAGGDLVGPVRRVFELHDAFTTEITQFFAELNQWQSRYDMTAEEVQFFAEVLVNYVAEQLYEIEHSIRPLASAIERIRVHLPEILPTLNAGLAARVDEAGLGDQVRVRRLPGSEPADWDHLAAWFVAGDRRAARLDVLTRQAFAAVRTLTANITRLSRESLGAVSRRADLARLASMFHQAESLDQAHRLASAAFGLGSCRHLGLVAEDQGDPVPSVTPWRQAPRAVVPVSVRARGETAQRGRTTPVRDRGRERERLRRQRELVRAEQERVRSELMAATDEHGELDDVELSVAAFSELRDAIGRSRIGGSGRAGISCELVRRDCDSTIRCEEGTLRLKEMVVKVHVVSID